MNGKKADAQFERIKEMVKLSKADCDIERVPGEYDSVHVRFIRRSEANPLGYPGQASNLRPRARTIYGGKSKSRPRVF
jgi:hypothetical protein